VDKLRNRRTAWRLFGKLRTVAENSTIEWTDATWNPTSGCVQVSPGCDHCYAMKFAERFRGVAGHYYEQGFDLALRPSMLDRPAQWHKPRRIFVNSMSDLFHVGVPDAYIDLVFDQMEGVFRHRYQLLTKRPERMRRYLRYRYGQGCVPHHIWIGVSIESNEFAWRADMLREVGADVRFLSLEPLIGPVDQVSFEGISWVIVGGESGPQHRPMDERWVRSVRDRCACDGIAFFFKQWHKKGTGRTLDGRIWDELPLKSVAVP
jgi:protein gp37